MRDYYKDIDCKDAARENLMDVKLGTQLFIKLDFSIYWDRA